MSQSKRFPSFSDTPYNEGGEAITPAVSGGGDIDVRKLPGVVGWFSFEGESKDELIYASESDVIGNVADMR